MNCRKSWLMTTLAAAALTAHANAQDGQLAGAADDVITVTASRLNTSNFDAPTPVAVVGAELIDQRGATNIANTINEMPAFTGTITPSATNLNSRQNGVNAVDLRGLGTNRNLVLINGRRAAPFDEYGNIDLNAVPSLAIDRVEIVTGGASAAWGSDAVSGVVNIIFDNDLEGLKLNAQYGQSDNNDAEDYRFSAAWGSHFNEDRGHILLAGDYVKNKGIPEGRDRDWQRLSPALIPNNADTGPNDGIPQFRYANNAVLFVGSPNGVTLPSGTPTGNLEFFPDGTARDRQLGEIGGNFMVGGSGARLGDSTAIFIPVERFSLLGAFEHELADNLEFFAEASFSQSESRGALLDAFSLGNVTITPDNPYLPADVAAAGESFSLFRTFTEFDPITSISKNQNMRFVGGVRGSFGESWQWEVSAQHGRGDFSNDQENNLLVGNLIAAADAVYDPSVDDVVCRANLGGANGAPGCSPINLFGAGSPSAESIAYITETGTSDTEIEQSVVAATLSGELFEGWAGPILTSAGFEYREESLSRTVSAENDNEEFSIVNAQPLNGAYNVKEGFLEVGVPLIGGSHPLDFNGAVRYTDYSTIGGVLTWKTGLVFSPTEMIRLRGSVSRDIRSPSIGETFVETVLLFTNISNPFNGMEELIQVPVSGNPTLEEESALTTTAGVVFTTGGFEASVDWYRIDLDGAIGVLGGQSIANRCFGGETELCELIEFGAGQSIISISNQNLNLGTFEVQGLDFEGRYSQPLGAGELSLGFVGSYLLEKNIAPSGGTPKDVAGELGSVSGFGTPDFRATVSAAYDTERWGGYAQLRYIGDGLYDPDFGPEQLSDSENHIGSVVYLDLSANYVLENVGGGMMEIYGGVDNVLDRDPPLVPDNFISNLGTNANHYGVIGRKFYVGVRASF